jgi:hypothetical protein
VQTARTCDWKDCPIKRGGANRSSVLAQASWYSPVASSPVFTENPTSLSSQFAASANRRFDFYKSRQLFIRVHNEALPIIAVCIGNERRSSAFRPRSRSRLMDTVRTTATHNEQKRRSYCLQAVNNPRTNHTDFPETTQCKSKLVISCTFSDWLAERLLVHARDVFHSRR